MRRLLLVLVFFLLAACARPAIPIRTATSGDYPPLSVWRGDRVGGFAPAVVESFAAVEKVDIAWSRFRWPELVPDLRAGRFDLAADGITVRPERSIAGRFTVPIARGGAVLLVRRPAWAASAEIAALDRAELRVVVNKGGHLERVTRERFKNANVRAIPDNTGVRDAFARGEADAAMTNTFEAPRWSEGLAGVEAIGPLTNDVTALFVRADRGDLSRKLDAWLLEEEESGNLHVLRTMIIGPGSGPKTALPVSALLAATAERLALMPFVAAAKKRSGAAIEDAAQEERVIASAKVDVENAARGRRAPPPAVVEEFLRAQIEAAKTMQEHPKDEPSFSLGEELRPAIARITARMAFLVVRVPQGTNVADVLAQAEIDLKGLPSERIERISRSIAAFGAP